MLRSLHETVLRSRLNFWLSSHGGYLQLLRMPIMFMTYLPYV